MKRRFFYIFLSGWMGFLACAQAEDPSESAFHTGSHFISAYSGLSLPVTEIDFAVIGGGKDKIASAGGSYGAQYLYLIKPRWGIGLDLNYVAHRNHRSTALLPSYTISSKEESTIVMLGPRKRAMDSRTNG